MLQDNFHAYVRISDGKYPVFIHNFKKKAFGQIICFYLFFNSLFVYTCRFGKHHWSKFVQSTNSGKKIIGEMQAMKFNVELHRFQFR